MDTTASERKADLQGADKKSIGSNGTALQGSNNASTPHFDQFAGDYKQLLDQSIAFAGEDSEYFFQYKASYLARIFSREFSGHVLDYGCGVGMLSKFIKKEMPAAQINGFDVSTEGIGRVDPALLQQGMFTSDPAQLARDYDLILVANVMHHVEPAERQALVCDLAGRLAAGGRLVILEHNPMNPVTRLVVERCAFDEGVILLSPRETSSYIRSAQLRVVRRDYVVFMPRLLAWLRPLEPWLAWLPLGAQFAVVGEKPA